MKPCIIDFQGTLSPEEHMDRDRRLLDEGNNPFLRFYTWPWPSCSFGLFTDPKILLKEEALHTIPHAKRPTGGGLLFHGRDLSFSLFLPEGHHALSPNSKENYRRINETVLHALIPLLKEETFLEESAPQETASPFHFCQAQTTTYDLHIGSKKIGGVAERRTKRGMLHQTSLFLYPLDWELLLKAVREEREVRNMQEKTISLSELFREAHSLEIPSLVERLSESMTSSLFHTNCKK